MTVKYNPVACKTRSELGLATEAVDFVHHRLRGRKASRKTSGKLLGNRYRKNERCWGYFRQKREKKLVRQGVTLNAVSAAREGGYLFRLKDFNELPAKRG